MRKVMTYVVFVVLVFFSSVAAADIYKWRDEHGHLHFGDRIPDKYKNQDISLHAETSVKTTSSAKKDSKKKVFWQRIYPTTAGESAKRTRAA